MAYILIIDDDLMVSNMLARGITEEGHTVDCVKTLKEGVDAAVSRNYDVVFLDVRMPDGNGLKSLPAIKRTPSAPEVIIITGMAGEDGARLAIKNGAWDYIEKPFKLEAMALSLLRVLEYRKEKQAATRVNFLNRMGIRGDSPLLLEVLDRVAEASSSDINVLLFGETGTGKGLFARAIHGNSALAGRPLVVVDCASLPETLAESVLFGHIKGAFTGADQSHEGLLKQAHGGTLFLDEVGELSPHIQKAFLHVLQEGLFRPVGSARMEKSHFRLISATNRDLDDMVRGGTYRADLLFRLRSKFIELPCLRERSGDIEELALHFLLQTCRRYQIEAKGFSPDFMEALNAYQWPGNIRELISAMEDAVLTAGSGSTLYSRHLPPEIRIHNTVSALRNVGEDLQTNEEAEALTSFREYRVLQIRKLERDYLTRLMFEAGGDIGQALAISGLGRSRLYGLLKDHGLQITNFKFPASFRTRAELT